MSDIFFTQMGIPEPAVNLHAGTGLHGEMTARMLARIETRWWARDTDSICEAVRKAGQGDPIPEFGEGSASQAIVDILAGFKGHSDRSA